MAENKKLKIAIHCLGVQAEQEFCEECDIYDKCHTDCKDVAVVAIKALKEVQQYREIGTVEECRKAVEKQKPKKPHRNYKKFSGLWCKCGWYLGEKQCLDIKYCPNCGQAISMEREEE